MTTKTETFTREGRHFATLIEENNGVVIVQRWSYAADASAYRGAPLGGRATNVCLVDPESLDFNALVAAHQKLCAEANMSDAGNLAEDPAALRAHFDKQRGHITLHANNYFHLRAIAD